MTPGALRVAVETGLEEETVEVIENASSPCRAKEAGQLDTLNPKEGDNPALPQLFELERHQLPLPLSIRENLADLDPLLHFGRVPHLVEKCSRVLVTP